jgi:hypothetical protein
MDVDESMSSENTLQPIEPEANREAKTDFSRTASSDSSRGKKRSNPSMEKQPTENCIVKKV